MNDDASYADADPDLLATRRHAPAVARNRAPILEVLRGTLPRQGTVLEIASGTGEHSTWFAPKWPELIWQPSDPDPAARVSIMAWSKAAAAANIRPPLELDVHAADWPISTADAVICINMIHIAPWSACQGLCRGAGACLPPGGVLFLYGPFDVAGRPMAASNVSFDASLRRQNPSWGIRHLDAVSAEAASHGFDLERTVSMPSNNLSVVYRKR